MDWLESIRVGFQRWRAFGKRNARAESEERRAGIGAMIDCVSCTFRRGPEAF